MTAEPTPEQVSAVIELLATLAQVIKTRGSIPSGELYAAVMGGMSLDTYLRCIAKLVSLGVVKQDNHLLSWIGQ